MKRNAWLRFGGNVWSLGIEASSVIALRAVKIAKGGLAGEVEARRMVSEKVEAGLHLQRLALIGRLGLTAQGAATKTLAHYRALPARST